MDCSNCGTPLQELTGVCIYCGASRKNKGDTPEITIVKVSDRDCPRCNIKLDTVCIPSDILSCPSIFSEKLYNGNSMPCIEDF